MNELGFAEPHIVEAIVIHISGSKSGVAGRYNHAQYLEQRREALDKWGRYLTWSAVRCQDISAKPPRNLTKTAVSQSAERDSEGGTHAQPNAALLRKIASGR